MFAVSRYPQGIYILALRRNTVREEDLRVEFIIRCDEDGTALFYRRRGVLPRTKILFINKTGREDIVVTGQLGTRSIETAAIQPTTITAPTTGKVYHINIQDKKAHDKSREYLVHVQPNNGDQDLCFVVYKNRDSKKYELKANVAKVVGRDQKEILVDFRNETGGVLTIKEERSGDEIDVPADPKNPLPPKKFDIIPEKPLIFSVLRSRCGLDNHTQQSGGTEQAEIIIIETP